MSCQHLAAYLSQSDDKRKAVFIAVNFKSPDTGTLNAEPVHCLPVVDAKDPKYVAARKWQLRRLEIDYCPV